MLNCDTPPQPRDVSRAGQYTNFFIVRYELPSLEVDTVKSLSIIVPDMKERREATTAFQDLCPICCVLLRLNTWVRTQLICRILLDLPFYTAVLVFSTIRVLL